MTSSASVPDPTVDRWQRFSARTLRAFYAYANWLVSISWWRFIGLALLLLVVVGILHDLPPFTWTMTERNETRSPRTAAVPPKAPEQPGAGRNGDDKDGGGVEINIGKDGVRITPHSERPATAASAAEAAAAAAAAAGNAAQAAAAASSAEQGIRIVIPPGATSDAVREAVKEARREIAETVREARDDARQAARDAADARRDAERAAREIRDGEPRSTTRTTRVGIGDVMMQFTFLWIVASAAVKMTYKGRVQAEVKAAQATETAEAESLKRQVVEARMAAMQAQVEPHFLFNTLASIDHLIETDPPRASMMQKNLIALLRASMPTMREANGNANVKEEGNEPGNVGVRDLGREIAVIRPYLEILKVRMEERLSTELAVPDGLLSAEFPPMMLQTLVENAIKHGLEPKAEGGSLVVRAEIVHGKLHISVADTGLGFGEAASSGLTAGTGVGLANIRERLQLLYGGKASLSVAENRPSGTVATITVPYRTVDAATA